MKSWIFLLAFNIIGLTMYGQSGELTVQGVSPNLYLLHTVAPKENWYSIGRIYDISPKEIAPYNNLGMDKPLSIGQQIKIPLNSTNFSQAGSKSDNQSFTPVYYTLKDKEWMYRLTANYKVSAENIEKWNGIDKSQVKPGMKLIIGYLKAKSNNEIIALKQLEKVNTPATPPVVEEKKQDPVIAPTPAKNNSDDFFKSQYEQTGKSNSGTAGVFKSNSGWQDGKYYALMNNVPVGTIIKITSASSNKSVYAKILGNMADMKENSGLLIRLSDAAAEEIGSKDVTKFAVEVKY